MTVLACLFASLLLVSAALFLVCIRTKPTSFNLFANDYTDLNFMGFEDPSGLVPVSQCAIYYYSCPVFSWLWPMLARNNMNLK